LASSFLGSRCNCSLQAAKPGLVKRMLIRRSLGSTQLKQVLSAVPSGKRRTPGGGSCIRGVSDTECGLGVYLQDAVGCIPQSRLAHHHRYLKYRPQVRCRRDRNDTPSRASIGVVFSGHLLYDHLTVRDNLSTRGSFYGLKALTPGQGWRRQPKPLV
jgi:hypothetical protein